jgi:hypothetical protein
MMTSSNSCPGQFSAWFVLLLTMFSIRGVGQRAAQAPGSVPLTATQDVQAAIQAAPPGTTFLFSPGIYRQVSIIPKDGDRFLGQGSTVLNGSKLLKMQPDGDLWSAAEPVAKSDPKYCLKDHPRCFILSDLFIDDHIQAPVADRENLGPGTWYYDLDAQKVYLSTNPAGHKVELSTTVAAFSGRATNVQISGLVVEKYASPPQRGAIGSGGVKAIPSGWTVTNVEARWNHGAGIHLGSNGRIDSCNVHDNGQLGLGGSGADILVSNNTIAFNNYAGYRVDWEAGATKFAKTDHLIVRSNNVHDNQGNGIWTDIDNIHLLVEKNTVVNNANEGIRHEIGYDAVIRDNLLRGNEAGIVIALSANVEVYGNVIEVPDNGSFAFRLDVGHRVSESNEAYLLQNVSIHNNVVIYLGAKGRSGLVGDASSAHAISFDMNEYHIMDRNSKDRWRWNNRVQSLSDLQQLGLETHGKIAGPLQQFNDPTRKNRPD